MKLGNSFLVLASCAALVLSWGACKTDDIDTENEIGGSGGTTTSSGTGGATGGGDVGGGDVGGGVVGGGGTGGDVGTGGAGGSGPDCWDDCDVAHAAGVDDYWNYAACAYCSACFDSCGGVGDVCESGSELGCSANEADCETCANSVCTADVDGQGVYSGVCAPEYQSFLENQDAVDLNDCYIVCDG